MKDLGPAMRIATHDGSFHADDVLSYVVLRAVFGDVALVRTRNSALLDAADIVFDVGQAYDPRRGRYDHHMRDAPKRSTGETLSSAGLIWRDYGKRALQALEPDLDAAEIDALHQALDRDFILPIDLVDNGEGGAGADPLCFSRLIETYVPQWHEDQSDAAHDDAFRRAAVTAETTLLRQIASARAGLLAEQVVLAADAAAQDHRILELPRSVPWHEAVQAHGLPALYAVYPDKQGRWRIGCMPSVPGSYDQRRPLPAAWGGVAQDELRQVSGVPDAIFCHRNLFVAAAESRDGALAMARAALED